MTIVSTSYSSTNTFSDPHQWLQRIDFYTGILEELAKKHEVVSIERINYEGEVQQNGVEYHFMRLKNEVVYLPTKMHKFIKDQNPDVVLVNGLSFPLQVLQLRRRLGPSVKIILFHRADRPFEGMKGRLQRMTDKEIDAYLFSSSEFADQWKNNINVDKVSEVMHASSTFQPANKVEAREKLRLKGNPLFLWVGRLDRNKDPLTVVKAFKQLLFQHPSAVLYMIYQTEELLKEVEELTKGIENIRLIGKVAHQDLQDWYNASDFMVSGSHYEGGGISVCEALSCGCIPIVTNITSFRAITGRGKCGLLYAPGSEEELLKAFNKAMKLDVDKERENTLRQFNDELSFAAIARKIGAVINSIDKRR